MDTNGWRDESCGFPTAGLLPASPITTSGYVCESTCGNGKIDAGETCDAPGPGCSKTCQVVQPCNEAGAISLAENGHCYFRTTATFTAYTTALATACPAGTHLATLDTPAETEAAIKAITTDAWIALRATTTVAQFRWDLGSEVFNPRRYHGFLGVDPDEDEVPACTVVSLGTPPTKPPAWRDRDCDDVGNPYVALCEREQGLDP
jgi:hypothetical protein